MIWLGTSGYSYADWHDTYYPAGLATGDRLAFYCTEFQAVEINYTYYRMPTAEHMLKLAAQTPDGFQFAVQGVQSALVEHPHAAILPHGVGGRGRRAPFLEALRIVGDFIPGAHVTGQVQFGDGDQRWQIQSLRTRQTFEASWPGEGCPGGSTPAFQP